MQGRGQCGTTTGSPAIKPGCALVTARSMSLVTLSSTCREVESLTACCGAISTEPSARSGKLHPQPFLLLLTAVVRHLGTNAAGVQCVRDTCLAPSRCPPAAGAAVAAVAATAAVRAPGGFGCLCLTDDSALTANSGLSHRFFSSGASRRRHRSSMLHNALSVIVLAIATATHAGFLTCEVDTRDCAGCRSRCEPDCVPGTPPEACPPTQHNAEWTLLVHGSAARSVHP